MKTYQPIVCSIAELIRPRSILDLPSGSGWLRREINQPDVAIDGIDLYQERPAGYRNFLCRDLEEGVPDELGSYDMIVSCEGIEHIANPGLFLKSARRHLNPGGVIVITTPNTWYPGARLQYFQRGFFPGFPSLAGRIEPGTHMHILPWSWPQLYLHLSLAGFTDIELHSCLEDERTRWIEKILALPMKAYCSRKARISHSPKERQFWTTCAEPGALYARRLVVSGRNPANS